MLNKLAQIFSKLSGTIGLVICVAIVLAVFIVGVLFAFGGDLGKFKKGAAYAIKIGSMDGFNASAKNLMPLRVRKQFKSFKLNGGKPDDYITPDVCVQAAFKESVASRLPHIVTVAGLLSIALSFALAALKGGNMFVIPAIVTAFTMLLRLAAGLISTAILKSGLKAYDKYVTTLAKCSPSSGVVTHEPPVTPVTSEIPVVDIPATTQEPMGGRTITYDATFGEPERINVELADEEENNAQTVYIAEEPTAVPVEDVAATVEVATADEPVIVAPPVETPEEARARARAEAIARLKAEQAQRQAANGGATQPAPKPAAAAGSDIFAKVDAICANGGPATEMKAAALQLQKERTKPENQTPEMQAKFKESLTKLLKAMSAATKK